MRPEICPATVYHGSGCGCNVFLGRLQGLRPFRLQRSRTRPPVRQQRQQVEDGKAGEGGNPGNSECGRSLAFAQTVEGRSCLGSVNWLNVGVALADEYPGIGCGNIAMAQGWENRSGTASTRARNLLGHVIGGRPREEQRRSVRLQAETLSCNLGAVVDLSAGGTRILVNRELSGMLDVTLWDTDRQLTLRAEVIWCKRLGFRKFEVGLKFRRLKPVDAGELTELASSNSSYLNSSLNAA